MAKGSSGQFRHSVSKNRLALYVALACVSGGVCAQAAPPAGNSATAAVPTSDPAADKEKDGKEKKAEPATLERVVVTAGKRDSFLNEVAGSVGVLSGKAIEESGARGFEGFIQNDPGATFNKNEQGIGVVTVRGLATESSPTPTQQVPVGTYLGDVPVSDPTNLVTIVDLMPIDLERVEVLKGPQGVLYGSNSLAGAVRYIFARPDLTENAVGYATVSGAGTAGGRPSYGATAVGNFANTTETVGVRLAAGYDYAGGYVDNVTAGVDNSNNVNTSLVRLVGLAKPSADLTVSGTAMYQYRKSDDAAWVGPQAPTPYVRTGTPTEAPIETKFSYFDLVADYRLMPWLTLNSTTGYSIKDLDYRRDLTYSLGYSLGLLGLPPGLVAGLVALVPDYYNTVDGRATQFSQEFRLTSNTGGSLNYLAGLFYQLSRADNAYVFGGTNMSAVLGPVLQAFGASPGAAAAATANDSIVQLGLVSRVQETAAFGEVEWKPWSSLALAVGGRYYNNRIEVSRDQSGVFVLANNLAQGSQAVSESLSANTTESGFTPRFTVRYTLAEDQNVYALASRGYRIGGVNLAPADPQFSSTYSPDRLWNYEIGYRGQFGRFLGVAATLFYFDWSDAQVVLFSSSGFAYTTNVGKAVSSGAELSAVFGITNNLDLTVGGAYTVAETRSDLTLSGVAVPSGTTLPSAPRWRMANTLNWRFGGPWESRGAVAVTHTYVGPTYSDLQRSYSLGGYNRLDARVGFTRNDWNLALVGTNLTGTTAAQTAISAGAGSGLGNFYLVRPRTIGVAATYNF